MTDNADERVIAEWFAHMFHDSATASDEERIRDGDFFTGSEDEVFLALPADKSIHWSPSTDANLWPGIVEKVLDNPELAAMFETRLERQGIITVLDVLDYGPEAWTRALAQAIRQMKGGG